MTARDAYAAATWMKGTGRDASHSASRSLLARPSWSITELSSFSPSLFILLSRVRAMLGFKSANSVGTEGTK